MTKTRTSEKTAVGGVIVESAAVLDDLLSEKDFQWQVRQLAQMYGWLEHANYESRRSTPGVPDLLLVRPPRVIHAEIKASKGRTSASQKDWLAALSQCPVEVYLWRPCDFDAIVEILR
jgi:hypothetical protein